MLTEPNPSSRPQESDQLAIEARQPGLFAAREAALIISLYDALAVHGEFTEAAALRLIEAWLRGPRAAGQSE